MTRLAVTSATFASHPDLVRALADAGLGDARMNSKRRLSRPELEVFLRGCRAAILGLDPVDAALLEACPDLELIASFGVGLDHIDLEACERAGVQVVSSPGVNRTSVAEHTLGVMLSLSRQLHRTSALLARGVWQKSGGSLLSGKTVGIIGVGHVGREVIRLLEPFGCRVLGNDIVEQREYFAACGILPATKQELYRQSDIVSIHTPLTSRTRNMIDRSVFERMQRHAYLVNTARGEIVVEQDLEWALESGAIAGAAIDVYAKEPPTDLELLSLPSLMATPHTAGNAREAVIAMGRAALEHVVKYLASDRDSRFENARA